MSRCIERSRFSENGLDEHRVQGDASHQIHRSPEDLRQFVGEIVDFPSEPCSGTELIEQVDVAVLTRCTAGDGSEDGQSRNPVPVAHGSEPVAIDVACGVGGHGWHPPSGP